MVNESYRDRGVQEEVYEYQGFDEITAMLSQSDNNSRVNEGMARWIMSASNLVNCFKGKYKELLVGTPVMLQVHNLNLDGFARNQAIAMKGASTMAEAQQKQLEEKKGIKSVIGL